METNKAGPAVFSGAHQLGRSTCLTRRIDWQKVDICTYEEAEWNALRVNFRQKKGHKNRKVAQQSSAGNQLRQQHDFKNSVCVCVYVCEDYSFGSCPRETM